MSRVLVRDGVRWEIDGLPEEEARAVFAWAAGDAAPGTVVKENRVRRVVRIPARSGSVYLKHDCFRGLGASLRFLLAPSRARAEWDTARRLSECKVPTVRPLAVGERRRGGFLVESFLVTAGIDGAEPLDSLLREERIPPAGGARGRWRRQVARALGEIVAKFHAGGFWHRDLHLGNFLAQPLGETGPAISVIDLHKARRPAELRPKQWISDLAWLDYGSRTWTSRTDRARFLKTYLRGMPAWPVAWKDAARVVSEASAARARFHRARRRRRAVSRLRAERTPWGEVRRAPGVDPARVAAVVAQVREGAEPIRDTPRARVLRVRLPAGETLCVKTYHPRALGPLSRDRAGAAWRAAEGCRLRGIETPRGMALVTRIPGLAGSLLVMEDLGRLPWLTHHAALHLRDPGMSRGRRAACAEAVGVWLRKLHGEGIRHADLKGSNILVREGPQGTRFVLLDLEDVDFPKSVSRRNRERALVQLNASLPNQVGRTDRLRAFRAYARGGAMGDAGATRESLRRIVRESLARRHRWGPGLAPWSPEPEGYGAARGPVRDMGVRS